MAKSIIYIHIKETPNYEIFGGGSDGITYFNFRVFDISSDSDLNLVTFNYGISRTASYVIPIDEYYTVGSNTFQRTKSYLFKKYFDIDYNSSNQFTVTIIDDDNVTVELNDEQFGFRDFNKTHSQSGLNYQEAGIDTLVVNLKNSSASTSSFNLLSHVVEEDDTDVCNFIKHVFETDVNCEKYLLDGIESIVNNTNFNIRYPRGQEFKVKLYGQGVSSNILSFGIDNYNFSIGFYINGVQSPTDFNVNFKLVDVLNTGGFNSYTIRYKGDNSLMSNGTVVNDTISVSPSNNEYDYFDFPFEIKNMQNLSNDGFHAVFEMEIISSTTGLLPVRKKVTIITYLDTI